MKLTPRSALALTALAAAVPGGAGAQSGVEAQVHALAVVRQDALGALGGGGGWRPSGRARLSLTASLGVEPAGTTGRVELLASYHLQAYRRQGLAPYAGGGIATEFTESAIAEFILLVVGMESAPGLPWGVFVEAGVGGGVRLAVGLRHRRRVG